MIYVASPLAVIIFVVFVATVLGISFFFARKTQSAKGYFSAGGSIHWSVNGIAFAGDYLSAASFLGICGLIAVAGYDGFLYSIGYLAGWIVALFVVAEPLKRLGKYTFADALDAKFNSKGIQLMAGVSTLVVSIFYLIPQMVGAGVLVTPLLGAEHWIGVVIVGAIVIVIVSTAGMKSTTYVQFLKGALLIVFSIVLTVLLVNKGLEEKPSDSYHDFITLEANMVNGQVSSIRGASGQDVVSTTDYTLLGQYEKDGHTFVKIDADGYETWWDLKFEDDRALLYEALSIVEGAGGEVLYNGAPKEEQRFYSVGHASEIIVDGEVKTEAKGLDIFSYLATITDSTIVRFKEKKFEFEGEKVRVFYQEETAGSRIMRPGLKFSIDEGASPWQRLDFMSLMIALFFGTAALPHVLIRYYTVPTPGAARKSTIVAIGAIGLFYILTLFMGLGAMTNGVIDVESSNMAAPLLAKSFGTVLFAIISAIAFATVLGTVSGLIVASSGAVAHDLMDKFMGKKLQDKRKVWAGKIAAIVVGIIAIGLGILFKGMNVAFLVGWAFAVAASANLPSILMLLFWKKTTYQGIVASIITGIISALGIILLSPDMFERYGFAREMAPIPLSNPAIISVPLSFLALVIASLVTQNKKKEVKAS